MSYNYLFKNIVIGDSGALVGACVGGMGGRARARLASPGLAMPCLSSAQPATGTRTCARAFTPVAA